MNGLQIALTLFGGLALFIYGMNLMSDGLQKAAGEKMKSILALLTKNPLIGVLAGALVTAVLQSSSATTVMVIGFVSAGLMNLPQAISIILGANIGTTITANIAAAVGNANARRAALAHTLFNLFGVCWALALFRPFLMLVGTTITWLGLPNPMEIVHSADVVMTADESMATLYGVSMLHTLFNIFNTIILIWFVNVIVKIASTVIKDKKSVDEDSVKLKFIDAGHLSTAELAVGQARNEVVHFAEVSSRTVGFLRTAIEAGDAKEFEAVRQRLVKYEEIADRMEYEIAQFLNALPEDSISEETRTETKRMYKIIGELESLGDSGESVSRILARRNSHSRYFSDEQKAKIESMLKSVEKAYDVMIDNLRAEKISPLGLRLATDCEIEINDLRNNIREEEILKIEQDGVNYQSSVYYLDTVSEIERMGDFIINISQALVK